MAEPCAGRETHHAGCECHEAKRAAEVASLRARVAELEAQLATARREGADQARRIPLKIYLVEGNVIAARSVREAAAIAEDQCGDAGPITGPLAGGTTVPVGTTTGEVVQIPVGKLLASGVQRGVVTRTLPLDAPTATPANGGAA